MKILHFTQSMSAGGIEAIICNLLNEMIKGNDVTLATIYAIDKDQVNEKKLDKRIKRISLGKTKQGRSFRLLFKIYRIIKKGNYDVVHIHGWFYYFVLSVLFLHNRVKFFYTIHNDAIMENTSMDLRIFRLKKMCFQKKYIYPITISSPSKQSFTNLYSTDSKLIYNGIKNNSAVSNVIEEHNYKVTSNTKVFIHPARISAQKNQEVLVRVFDRLIKEGYDIVLLIAGPIRDKQIFENLEKYFCKRIQYIGVRSDIPQLMSCSFGFCLSSIYEGLPVTLLESLSTGCIPVCSPVGGVIEVIRHGYNGFLSKSSNEDDYYEVMKTVLSCNEESLAHISANCVESFKRFDIKGVSKEYLDYYQEILDAK